MCILNDRIIPVLNKSPVCRWGICAALTHSIEGLQCLTDIRKLQVKPTQCSWGAVTGLHKVMVGLKSGRSQWSYLIRNLKEGLSRAGKDTFKDFGQYRAALCMGRLEMFLLSAAMSQGAGHQAQGPEQDEQLCPARLTQSVCQLQRIMKDSSRGSSDHRWSLGNFGLVSSSVQSVLVRVWVTWRLNVAE